MRIEKQKQGHIDYRIIAQKMADEITRVHPSLANGMLFIDRKNYDLERLDAEKYIDKRLAEVENKYKK